MTDQALARIAAEVVAAEITRLPADVRKAAESVPVHVQPVPGPDLVREGIEPDLLGLFMGSPEGTELSGENLEPPRILLYTANLWDFSGERLEAYREEVRLTFLHELGHFLGWDEDQVADRGLE